MVRAWPSHWLRGLLPPRKATQPADKNFTPSTVTANTGGRFGPNFDFTDNATATTIPEPTTLAIS